MSRIELYSQRDFEGDSVSLNADTPSLALKGFNDYPRSMKVFGEPWVVFVHADYKGNFELYRPGNYNSLGELENTISSVRAVKGGLDNPEITVYEHSNYGGRAVTLKKNAENLLTYEFNDMISSHKVSRGAWVLFEHIQYQGGKMLALAGDHVPNYVSIGWNDKVSSIRLL